jgi:membrane protein YdbS with pleckstrin-like domain
MNKPQLQFRDVFIKAFRTRAGIARLSCILLVAVVIGMILGVANAPKWLTTAVVIIGAIIAGTIVFAPIYRHWVQEGSGENDEIDLS